MFGFTSTIRKSLVAALSLLTLGAIAACGGSPATNQPPTSPVEPTGKVASSPLSVLSITGGNVLVRRADGSDWTPGQVGMTLDPGFSIKTDSGATATITFFEGSTVELAAGTEVRLADLGVGQGKATTIRLKQEIGSTISRVKKLADPASRYEVETAAAVAAVRGTIMSVAVKPDGTTTVGNIQGLVAVIARGVEVMLPEGQQSVVVPGNPPGLPTTLTTSPAGTTTPPPTTSAAPPSTTPAATPRISVTKKADRTSAIDGDTVTYTYEVINLGALPLSGVAVSDDKAEPAVLQSGDANSNSQLDPAETWTFKALYLVRTADVGQLTNTATASGTASGQTATATATFTIAVTRLTVKFTNLKDGDIVGRTLNLSGTVNDPAITQATLSLNGTPRTMSVANGAFAASVTLVDGVNTITVTVTKPGGVTASDTLTLEPAPA